MFISSWRRYCKRARDITDSIDVLGHFWHATRAIHMVSTSISNLYTNPLYTCRDAHLDTALAGRSRTQCRVSFNVF